MKVGVEKTDAGNRAGDGLTRARDDGAGHLMRHTFGQI